MAVDFTADVSEERTAFVMTDEVSYERKRSIQLFIGIKFSVMSSIGRILQQLWEKN